jgi:hypothetical protein
VSVGVGDDTTHAHLGSALDQAVRDEAVSISNGCERSSNGEDTIVDAGDNLADASANTSLVAKVGDVLSGLANDHTSFLGSDDGTESELSLVVLFLGARVLGAVGVERAKLVGDVVNTAVNGRRLDVLGRHGRKSEGGVELRVEVGLVSEDGREEWWWCGEAVKLSDIQSVTARAKLLAAGEVGQGPTVAEN